MAGKRKGGRPASNAWTDEKKWDLKSGRLAPQNSDEWMYAARNGEGVTKARLGSKNPFAADSTTTIDRWSGSATIYQDDGKNPQGYPRDDRRDPRDDRYQYSRDDRTYRDDRQYRDDRRDDRRYGDDRTYRDDRRDDRRYGDDRKYRDDRRYGDDRDKYSRDDRYPLDNRYQHSRDDRKPRHDNYQHHRDNRDRRDDDRYDQSRGDRHPRDDKPGLDDDRSWRAQGKDGTTAPKPVAASGKPNPSDEMKAGEPSIEMKAVKPIAEKDAVKPSDEKDAVKPSDEKAASRSPYSGSMNASAVKRKRPDDLNTAPTKHSRGEMPMKQAGFWSDVIALGSDNFAGNSEGYEGAVGVAHRSPSPPPRLYFECKDCTFARKHPERQQHFEGLQDANGETEPYDDVCFYCSTADTLECTENTPHGPLFQGNSLDREQRWCTGCNRERARMAFIVGAVPKEREEFELCLVCEPVEQTQQPPLRTTRPTPSTTMSNLELKNLATDIKINRGDQFGDAFQSIAFKMVEQASGGTLAANLQLVTQTGSNLKILDILQVLPSTSNGSDAWVNDEALDWMVACSKQAATVSQQRCYIASPLEVHQFVRRTGDTLNPRDRPILRQVLTELEQMILDARNNPNGVDYPLSNVDSNVEKVVLLWNDKQMHWVNVVISFDHATRHISLAVRDSLWNNGHAYCRGHIIHELPLFVQLVLMRPSLGMADWSIGEIDFTPCPQQANSDDCGFFAWWFGDNEARGFHFDAGVPHHEDREHRLVHGQVLRWEVMRSVHKSLLGNDPGEYVPTPINRADESKDNEQKSKDDEEKNEDKNRKDEHMNKKKDGHHSSNSGSSDSSVAADLAGYETLVPGLISTGNATRLASVMATFSDEFRMEFGKLGRGNGHTRQDSNGRIGEVVHTMSRDPNAWDARLKEGAYSGFSSRQWRNMIICLVDQPFAIQILDFAETFEVRDGDETETADTNRLEDAFATYTDAAEGILPDLKERLTVVPDSKGSERIFLMGSYPSGATQTEKASAADGPSMGMIFASFDAANPRVAFFDTIPWRFTTKEAGGDASNLLEKTLRPIDDLIKTYFSAVTIDHGSSALHTVVLFGGMNSSLHWEASGDDEHFETLLLSGVNLNTRPTLMRFQMNSRLSTQNIKTISALLPHPETTTRFHQWSTVDNRVLDAVRALSFGFVGMEAPADGYVAKALAWAERDKGSNVLAAGLLVCDVDGCKKPFKTRTDLNQHIRQVHADSKFFCDVDACNNTNGFPSQATLAQHTRLVHDENKFFCDDSCKNTKGFPSQSALDKHIRRVHTTSRFFCGVDGCKWNTKGFKTQSNLKKHTKDMHGEE